MSDHTSGALASALLATGYVFDHIDAYEEPVGKCILLADLPKALAEAGYMLMHTAPDEATIERLATAISPALFSGRSDDKVGPATLHEREATRNNVRTMLADMKRKEGQDS